MEGLSDEALVQAVRRGEMRAFDVLYHRYADRLFGFLVRQTGSRVEAEDALQEVFMTVLRQDALELRDGRFCAWLFRVARNRAVGEARRQSRHEQKNRELQIPEAAPTPEDAAEFKQSVAHVEAAVSTLSEAHAEALMLKLAGGLTYKQIAHVQDVPEGTAKSRLHFAVRAVRTFLSEKNESPL